MPDRVRKYAVVAIPLAVLAVLAWALSGERRPQADFTFVNETEIFSVDPSVAHGQPEGRIVNALFEGLYRYHHETMAPKPGVAEALPEISADGRVYTIRLRADARWSDDRDEHGDAKEPSPVTAHDFVWSWQRLLFPATGAKNAQHLWHIDNARRYTQGEIEIGDRVEVELPKTENADQPYPRGQILRGKLVAIDRTKVLRQPEAMVLAQRPVIPLYFYVSKNMVRPYVKGFHSTLLDVHPLEMFRVDREEKDRSLRAVGLR